MTRAAPTDDDAALKALAGSVGAALLARGWKLATAESCTGGWIAKSITDVAGSSEWFVGGVVAYRNAVKQGLLGVRIDTLAEHGAVSRECAVEMVAGVLDRIGADVAVAVTGIAGPGGGSADKPVGTVWIAWQQRDGEVRAERFRFAGERDAVRRQAVAAGLRGLHLDSCSNGSC
ncbi:MAG: CinA family protein [Proteobacteria bacterium]|nr:CinA family protein [Pseudomonadota bacterium]